MSATFILSALLAATQAVTSTPGPEQRITEQREVAYEALTSGQTARAVAALEARLREDPQDPATLINLGTAYSQLGDAARAAQAFRSAMTSDTRYQLELADGSWADSRQVARRALQGLERTSPLAALSE